MGYAPEDCGIFPDLTVEENFQITAWLGKTAAPEAFSVFPEIQEFRTRRGLHLSGGQKKMLAITRALTLQPAVLLLDEPFEGVDPVSAVAVRTMLDRFRNAGGTVVFSSHAMDLVDRMCDHVAVMAKGGLLAAGPIEVLRGGGRLEDAFISMVGATPLDPTRLSWLDDRR